MKVLPYLFAAVLILSACPSCDKEVKNLREEIKVTRDENNFLKAENAALKKEREELYRKISEKNLVPQRTVGTEKDESANNKDGASKKPERAGQDKPKQSENGKTGQ